jgi:2'-5' RNA ligase
MATYHIEFRIRGRAKRYAKTLIYEVGRHFRVKGMTHRHVVPHISLYGPFLTRQERQVVAAVAKVCSRYRLVPFTFRGFNYFDNATNKVIYLDIAPSEVLVNLRFELARALQPITYSKSNEDKKTRADFKFHSTIAFKDIDNKFRDIWRYMEEKEKPEIKQHLLRVTIIKNSRILYEYDLMQQKLLNRRQALDKHIFAETIRILKSRVYAQEGISEKQKDNEKELAEGILNRENKRNESLLDRIRNLFTW